MSNLTSASGDQVSISSGNNPKQLLPPPPQPQPNKKKRNLPGNPDPDAEVVTLSPKTLLATNRFVCEICNKGFQRDQNLQLHRRGHNLPWKLKQRTSKEVKKKVYVCPEPTCVHHEPSRALGDLTGIKKHYYRKHGEKKWKCDKCSKRYAVQSDWKAHSKTCGSREYRCDCGTLFSRRDSFITHRAFCDALAEESARAISGAAATATAAASPQLLGTTQSSSSSAMSLPLPHNQQLFPIASVRSELPSWLACQPPHSISMITTPSSSSSSRLSHHEFLRLNPTTTGLLPPFPAQVNPQMSATALLQRAAQMGATLSNKASSISAQSHHHHHPQDLRSHGIPSFLGQSVETSLEDAFVSAVLKKDGDSLAMSDHHPSGACEGLTRDFLGLRHLSQTDILAMAAGFGSRVSSQPHENNSQSQRPAW